MDKSIVLVTVAVASAGVLVFLWHRSKQDWKNIKTPGGIGIRFFHTWTFDNQKAYLSLLMEKGVSLREVFASLCTPISQVAQLRGGVERYVEKLLQRELPAMNQMLLRSFRERAGSELKSRISESFQMLLGKNNDVDQAKQNFLEIIESAELTQYKIEQGTHYLPPWLGYTIALMLSEKSKGINMLRKIKMMPYSDEFSDEFECAYLLLAHFYMQGSKLDLASNLYYRCLDHNNSCLEALEGLGDVFLEEEDYDDAYVRYDEAWKLMAKQEHHAALAPIGFKFAQSLMKLDKVERATHVCCKVTSTLQAAPAS